MVAFGPRVVVPGQNSGASNGDTWDAAWSADDTLYFQHNDGTGFSNGAYAHDRICRLQGTPQVPGGLSGTDLNPGVLGNGLNGSPCYSTGTYEVDGALYHCVCYSQQVPGNWVFHHTSVLKSVDGGRNWMNHLGQLNIMPPDNTSQCMFPSDDYGEVNFVKYGRGGTAPPIDNALTYVYLSAAWSDLRLARIARSDLPKLDKSKLQFYAGGDGMLDSSWTRDITRSAPVPAPTVSPTAIIYDPALGRYLMTSFSSDSWQTPPIESTLRVMEALHPWGPWTLALDENVNNFEGDNLTWAYLVPKFTSQDGRKAWMSVSGRAPYGLQFLPVYLTTEPVQTQEAENAIIVGGSTANAKAGYSGSGYVTGLDAIGKRCEFTFNVGTGGVYILRFRYNTSAYRDLGLHVNHQSRGLLKLGKSEQVYATWTDMSVLTWLTAGTNLIALQCDDASGNVNLDKLSLALYSTSAVRELSARPVGAANGVAVTLETIPGLAYSLAWNSDLASGGTWQTVTNFIGDGGAFSWTRTSLSPAGFLRIVASQ